MNTEEKQLVIRFTTRKIGKQRRPVEIAYFYSTSGVKVFESRCEPGVIFSFLERIGFEARRSKKGKTIYLEGSRGEEVFRKLVILAGCRQSLKKQLKILDVAEEVAGLGEFEAIFWYSKMIEEHERKGFWGVCRVARAFRILHRID